MHMLAYGQVANTCNQYCRIGENTTFECLWSFVRTIREVFKLEFFRKPTQVDFAKKFKVNVKKGWPIMCVSLDYMHYHWKNCPVV